MVDDEKSPLLWPHEARRMCEERLGLSTRTYYRFVHPRLKPLFLKWETPHSDRILRKIRRGDVDRVITDFLRRHTKL